MKNKNIVAIHLVLTTILICAWLIYCPKYTVQGDTYHRYKKKIRHGHYEFEEVRHPETTIFWAVLLIIFLCTSASCVLFLNTKDPNQVLLNDISKFDPDEWKKFLKSEPVSQYLSPAEQATAFERWKTQQDQI